MEKLISNNKNLSREIIDFDQSQRLGAKTSDTIIYQGKKLVNLASNDYLGLSKDKNIIYESVKWLKKYGSSLSSSRLVTGNLDRIKSIEDLISKNINHEKSLIIGNGFLLNSTLIPVLTGNFIGGREKCFIFSDKLNHSSINHGCLISRQKCFRYNHLELNHLESFLKKVPIKSKKLIISETLFSMDGDFLDLDGIRYLSKKYNAILYLDEAHSIGIYGKNGFGICSDFNKNENEVIVGTLSKAFGCYGAFLSCSKNLHKLIVNKCAGLIYSTVLPPSVLGSIYAAVKFIPNAVSLREKLINNSRFVLESLNDLNFDTANSNSHIIPIIIKNSKLRQRICEFLLNKGFYVKEIRSPTVPINKERIRLSITATIKKRILKNFINMIGDFKKNEV